jgi:hypothetical protein
LTEGEERKRRREAPPPEAGGFFNEKKCALSKKMIYRLEKMLINTSPSFSYFLLRTSEEGGKENVRFPSLL